MGFQLVPKSVTLNDLERCNDRPLSCIFSPNLVALGADYVRVVEDRHILFGTKTVVQRIYSLALYAGGDTHRGYREREHYREAPER